MSTCVISKACSYDFEQIIIHSQTDKINKKKRENKQTEFSFRYDFIQTIAKLIFDNFFLFSNTCAN